QYEGMLRPHFFITHDHKRSGSFCFIVFMVLLCVFLMSFCSNTIYLAKDQSLLTGNALKLKGENLSHAELEDLRNNLNSSSIIQQRPNTKFLNLLRLKLWLYNKK